MHLASKQILAAIRLLSPNVSKQQVANMGQRSPIMSNCQFSTRKSVSLALTSTNVLCMSIPVELRRLWKTLTYGKLTLTMGDDS